MKKIVFMIFLFVLFCNPLISIYADTDDSVPCFVSLRTFFLFGIGRFDVYSKVYETYSLGTRTEIICGFDVFPFPGLEIGAGVSFLQIANETPIFSSNTFDIDVDPTEDGETIAECNLRTSITACFVILRAGYGLELGPIYIGLETGAGIGFLYERADWEVTDPDDTDNDLDADLERRESIKPAFEYNLKILYRMNQNNQLGMVIGGLSFPAMQIIAGDTIEFGPYMFDQAWQAGLVWKLSF